MGAIMADRFAACLAETLRWEGGYSNDPHDKGGPTMRGVTQRVYDGWRDGHGVPRRPVSEIELPEWEAIYRRNYWDAARAGDMPAGVDLCAWDMAVNAGPVQAIRSLQRVLGVTVDGHIGAATMGALQRRETVDLIRAYVEERRRYHRSLPTFWRFGKGWLRRCDGIEAKAIEMSGPVSIEHVDTVIAAPAPLPDPAEQSASQGRATPADPKPPWVTEVLLGTTGLASNVTGFSNAFTKIAAMPDPTLSSIALAFLSEPLVLTGIVTVTAAVTTWLWRRRIAQ
jgi:lysozyme family protein